MKTLLIGLTLLASMSSFANVDCSLSDKQLATVILNAAQPFVSEISIDSVKKKEVGSYDFNIRQLDLKASYCVDAPNTIINWSNVNDTELSQDGNASTMCVSVDTINQVKDKHCSAK